MRIQYCAMAVLLAAGTLLGAAEIGEIRFRQSGGVTIPDADLLINLQQRAGQEYVPLQLNEDTRRLQGTGYFKDVKSRIETRTDGKLAVTHELVLNPIVRSVGVTGNAKFKTSVLMEQIKVVPELPFSNSRYKESLRNLRKFYADKGYADAEITPVMEPLPHDGVKLTFRIAEHLRIRVNRVTFPGATVYSERELRGLIANRHSYFSWFGDAGLLKKGELELDKARLRDAYWDRGYLDFKVDNLKMTPDPADPEFMDLEFTVQEGKPYTVGAVEITGNKAVPSAELLPLLRLHPGQVFNYKLENESRQAIAHYYETLGYCDVTCRPVRSEDYETHTVKVVFEVNDGKKFTVRNVVISGNTDTRDKVIRRELAIQPSDPVDRTRIEASRSRLMGMGYFTDVKTTTVNADALDEKDVHIEVKERPDKFGLKIGAGFSDVNSLVGMVQLTSNNFDATNPKNWFYGGGQRLRLQGLFGLETMGFNADFTEPWLFDIPLRFDLSAYGNEVSYEKWDEQRIGFRTALSYRLFDDFTNFSLGYKFEQVNVRNMTFWASPELMRERGRRWVSQPSLMITRDTRDSLTDPTEGYMVSLLGAVSPKVLGSSDNFYRLEAKGSVYYSFFDKAIVWMAGAKIGTVGSFSGGQDVPLFERYFLGGGDTLRGFPYRQVSPVDCFRNNVGGQSMLLVTSEISHPIWNFIRGAVFIDAGNAWGSSWSYGMGGMNIGAGYGLRIKVPMLNAPIKLDLAYPLVNNQDDYSSKLQFHFNMGFTW